MNNISKIALVTTLVVGGTLLGSTSVSAFEGGMRGKMHDRGGKDRFHLVSQEMRDEFRAEHKAEFENLSQEERKALKVEHRAEKKAHREEHKQEVADFVGVSTDELKEARNNGTSIGDLLTQNGKTQDEANTFLTEKANERVDFIVERHELNSEEEASVRSKVTEFVANILGRWFN
jgi:DNA-directed RNA polymerase specialized sigma subunit